MSTPDNQPSGERKKKSRATPVMRPSAATPARPNPGSQPAHVTSGTSSVRRVQANPRAMESSGSSGSALIPILASIIALLVGLGAGFLMGRDVGSSTNTAGGGSGSPATPQPTAAAEASPTEAVTEAPPEEPTYTEEEMQRILEVRRSIPNRDGTDSMAIGFAEAPVVMVEFGDYRCGYCGRFTLETLPELIELVNNGTLRIEFRDFPIFQEESIDAAVAARAAARQDYFLEYHLAIYRYQFVEGGQDLTQDTFMRLAQDVGIPDLEQFQADLNDPSIRTDVERDHDYAMTVLGQASTPQFIINDGYLSGAQSTEAFLEVILEELEKLDPPGPVS